jgi:hypothetical protein
LKKDLKQKEIEIFKLETRVEKLEETEKKIKEENHRKLEQNDDSSKNKSDLILHKIQPTSLSQSTISTLSSLAADSESIPTISEVSTEFITYNIETWNSFENLKGSKSQEFSVETIEKQSSSSDLKL